MRPPHPPRGLRSGFAPPGYNPNGGVVNPIGVVPG
jgi:hypothetical protein